jgi:hypothetical protein
MSSPTPIVSSEDRPAWLRARRGGVTATDVAKLGPNPTAAALRRAIADKRGEAASWGGNAATRHGTAREPHIATWVQTASAAGRFGSGKLVPAGQLYAHPEHPRYLATPDGMSEDFEFYRELVEIKTTDHPWTGIPRDYLRQVWWQQFVLGADRTLVVWEQHKDGVPVTLEPNWQWVKRDQQEIDQLRAGADVLLAYMDDEAPIPPVDVDRRITKYLRLQERLEVIQAQMAEIESWCRDRAGDKPLTVLGTRGDLTVGASSKQTRFDSTAFKAADPKRYAQFQKTITVRPRLTIKPVERPSDTEKTQEAAA